ncbi:hypothetical protein [Dinghuibacter silviterrae]|uniref:Uncharacterized protein n=1 Tax=Dinghuibacter silviterrae TaxID=1539049 RepID=A0A4R8DH52_9BACT|nr:hypothetical protein [Dinghuibacter silviterrae]TDW96738.1 hypothetical protein EDB95_4574 [Dinghuibacter silviterrae]
MKQTMAVVLLSIFLGCQKSGSGNNNNNNNNGLANQPTAQATFDSQSGGVYKGSLTGSSGYFVVNLQATKPFIIYQWTTPSGNIDSLFTSSLGSWTSGQAITKAVFTGSDGSVFWFSVGANGSGASIDSVFIPGHTGPVYAAIGKELSTSQIKIFQGTGTTSGAGCYNGIVNLWMNSTTGAYAYLGTSGDFGSGPLSVSGNTVTTGNGGNNSENGTLTISSDGMSISGTVSNKSCTHAISATRIL